LGIVNVCGADGGAAVAPTVVVGAALGAGPHPADVDDEAIGAAREAPEPVPAPHPVRTTAAKTAEMSAADLFTRFSPDF
jgi:hypothetical protein